MFKQLIVIFAFVAVALAGILPAERQERAIGSYSTYAGAPVVSAYSALPVTYSGIYGGSYPTAYQAAYPTSYPTAYQAAYPTTYQASYPTAYSAYSGYQPSYAYNSLYNGAVPTVRYL